MAVNFIISREKTFVERIPDGERTLELKAKLYSLEFNRDTGFYLLDVAENYSLPKKTYGKYKELAERVIKTCRNKRGNTGVLLTGLKGTGKTLFMKFIANAMININTPVIQINKAYPGEEVFNFIENLGECVLVFNEFGKNYRSYDNGSATSQLSLLSLLDGLGNSKRLHLFTENDTSAISEYLLNRPGRVHYHFKHGRLNDEVIVEFCKDQSVPEDVVKEVLELSSKLRVLSFDILKCLIDEWKLYGGKVTDHIGILNITLCRDPDEEEIQLISITKSDGTSMPVENVRIDYRDSYIYLQSTDSYARDTIHINDAVSVKGNIYKFISSNKEEMIFKINTVHY